ncbi:MULTISPECIES: hypothetical protein [unclassified Variovorax]|uniref:hypothetical protein n=1 Tax=unclassified Variovorax TaxID=663243 RepID=UPI0013178B37|nr:MULTISPECIES: hypothetical protein [unclassified Variovorax]VTU42492.1 hypothetical protein SRS16P1_00283 [Variovorax sp. SRS16]VTU42515.1 hypothetical protein E5P1_00281 [Variovorax sp. PBL-E5]VTU44005.1 hypothetical protein H6P1_00648 [Variovorax sp. PBL-H6]
MTASLVSAPDSSASAPSNFADKLEALAALKGSDPTTCSERWRVKDELAATLLQRMQLHRTLFEPLWTSTDAPPRTYSDDFPPVDPATDSIHECYEADGILYAVVQRNPPGAAFANLLRIGFPMPYLADKGLELMCEHATATLKAREAALKTMVRDFDATKSKALKVISAALGHPEH